MLFSLSFVISVKAQSEILFFDLDNELLDKTPGYILKTSDYNRYLMNSFYYNIEYTITGGSAKYLIICNSAIYKSLQDKIIRYAEDINYGLNYNVKIYAVDNANHTDVKSILISEQEDLVGATFVGDIDEAYYETENDFNKYGYRSWPCDLYYMDLDGNWGDSDGNEIFDTHTGNVNPEIFIGRISAKGLSQLGSEAFLLGNYFDKNHRYWIGENYLKKKYSLAYTDSDWASLSSFTTISILYGSDKNEICKYGDPNFGKSNYTERLQNDRYEFVQLAAHSAPTMHLINGEYLQSSEICSLNINSYGLNLFCCSACNWTVPNNLAGSYIMNTESKVLSIVGSTKTGSMLGFNQFYLPLSQGETIGAALKQWWNYYCGNSHDLQKIYWHYGLSIIGDPLINYHYDTRDLYIQDDFSDDGTEPNSTSSLYSSSPDIWITNSYGSAVSHIEEGNQYLVNVRVHNAGPYQLNSTVNVKLNWTRVSSNMNWGRAWNGGITHPCDQIRGGFVGEQTLSAPIVAGGDGIVSIPWTVPARPTGLPHCSVLRYLNGLSYALLARVEDGHETVGEDLNDYNIRDFVLQNNNVAMKTYNILQENIRDNIVAVDMRRDRGDGIVRVSYSSTSNGSGTHISDVANVYLQFDSSMLAAWPQATRQMTGCRQVNDSVFVITDTTATFDGFLLDTAETYFISSYVRYRIPQADSTVHRFSLNFCIVDGNSVFADGDIDYTVMYDEAAYFNVTAYEDMTVMAGESFELSSEADAADAAFEWYNMQDVLIGTGDHISLSSTSTQQYYVRGYSPSDNTVGYDTVTVTVRHGIITKITPNPAHNQVLVKYTLADDVTNPTISLRNSNGMVVYSASIGTHPALCHINIKTIDVVPLPTGNYTVSLEDNGVVLDSKMLVVQ